MTYKRGVIIDFHKRYKVSDVNSYENTPCWEWKTKPDNNGYCRCIVNKNRLPVHRYSYIIHYGELQKNLVVDHLCRNTICVNPNHLEAVTIKENTLRGIGPAAKNSKKTHCKHGHEFTAENTYIDSKGRRMCKVCCKERARVRQGYKGYVPNKIKTYCNNGHVLSSENIYIRRGGGRNCKICAKRRASQQRERNKNE